MIIAYNKHSSYSIQKYIHFNIPNCTLKIQDIRVRIKLLHDVLHLLIVSDPLCARGTRGSLSCRLVSLTSSLVAKLGNSISSKVLGRR